MLIFRSLMVSLKLSRGKFLKKKKNSVKSNQDYFVPMQWHFPLFLVQISTI